MLSCTSSPLRTNKPASIGPMDKILATPRTVVSSGMLRLAVPPRDFAYFLRLACRRTVIDVNYTLLDEEIPHKDSALNMRGTKCFAIATARKAVGCPRTIAVHPCGGREVPQPTNSDLPRG